MIRFFDAQGQLTPSSKVGSGRNWNLSKLLRMSVLVALNNEEDLIKHEAARMATPFLPL